VSAYDLYGPSFLGGASIKTIHQSKASYTAVNVLSNRAVNPAGPIDLAGLFESLSREKEVNMQD